MEDELLSPSSPSPAQSLGGTGHFEVPQITMRFSWKRKRVLMVRLWIVGLASAARIASSLHSPMSSHSLSTGSSWLRRSLARLRRRRFESFIRTGVETDTNRCLRSKCEMYRSMVSSVSMSSKASLTWSMRNFRISGMVALAILSKSCSFSTPSSRFIVASSSSHIFFRWWMTSSSGVVSFQAWKRKTSPLAYFCGSRKMGTRMPMTNT
mmetsp:Transcript_110866/g.308795  ORF Transcript_110866/g.308795 Transcript_110866/m.308795 type:complete len:209 (-) Transcript_110866:1662-2288(-)